MADSTSGTIGPINWGSNAVNGQLVPQAPTSAFWPRILGGAYSQPGRWPRQGSWQIPPAVPSPAIAAASSPNATGIGMQSASTQKQSGNPWHPKYGTIIFGFGALIVGLFMLHYIHYGGGK